MKPRFDEREFNEAVEVLIEFVEHPKARWRKEAPIGQVILAKLTNGTYEVLHIKEGWKETYRNNWGEDIRVSKIEKWIRIK